MFLNILSNMFGFLLLFIYFFLLGPVFVLVTDAEIGDKSGAFPEH